MSVKLIKKILMASPEGAYLMSNCMKSRQESVFEEVVSPLKDRGKQWERIIASKANQKLCRIFKSKAECTAWVQGIFASMAATKKAAK